MKNLQLELDSLKEKLEILTIEGTAYKYVEPTEREIKRVENLLKSQSIQENINK